MWYINISILSIKQSKVHYSVQYSSRWDLISIYGKIGNCAAAEIIRVDLPLGSC